MNNGLPSLLDAIFGKNDLTQVSLEEIMKWSANSHPLMLPIFCLSKEIERTKCGSSRNAKLYGLRCILIMRSGYRPC